MDALVALAGRLERHAGLLGIVKLGNVVLAMIWGFVVTFVFVRLLPIDEFRSFLLLTAFANFTISADLGLSAIAYSRLRRRRVAGEGSFRRDELVALAWIMNGIVLLGALLILLALAAGLIATRQTALFMAFYAVSATNLLALLARRALAALDHNLWWEALDVVRRVAAIGLLLAALAGFPILSSVLIQLVLAVAILWIGFATIHRTLGMAAGEWFAVRSGLAHVRGHYLADFGRTGALTVFDVAAYNAPYFTIALATHDPRPLLLFDFVFKLSRTLSAAIRALVETVLPGITRAAYGGGAIGLGAGIRRCLGWSLGATAAAAAALLLVGPLVARIVFDGHIEVELAEILMIIALLFGLTFVCVSVYLQSGLGRFGVLVRPSFALFLGSLLAVPLATILTGGPGWTLSLAFVALYAAVHIGLGLVHSRMLGALSREEAV
jgi:hypothetical protein